MNKENEKGIKAEKGQYWSRPGAGAIYSAAVSSAAGIVRIKNMVEGAIVGANATGYILDAGTGTGRFARQLAMDGRNRVVALDFSQEMLDQNKKLATEQKIDSIQYVQGDVEHLQFPDNHFDSIVSITVVRHFPQWKNILEEYIRVLKPNGMLIFEMCSGNHIRAANKITPRFGYEYSDKSFVNYEAEVTFEVLKGFLEERGLIVQQRLTYDFFNSNCFIKIAALNKFFYRVFNKLINIIFGITPFPQIMSWFELHFLCYLPPVFSYNYMVVCKKK